MEYKVAEELEPPQAAEGDVADMEAKVVEKHRAAGSPHTTLVLASGQGQVMEQPVG